MWHLIAKLFNKKSNKLSKKEFKILSYIKVSQDARLIDSAELSTAKSLVQKGLAVNRGNGRFNITEKGLIQLRDSSYKSHF